MIDVELLVRATNRAIVPARALVDSGADRTLLPTAFADDFELDIRQLPTTDGRGAAGPARFSMWMAGARVRLLGLDFDLELKPALFGAVPVPVLGRADFFESFRCGFDERAQQFWVERY